MKEEHKIECHQTRKAIKRIIQSKKVTLIIFQISIFFYTSKKIYKIKFIRYIFNAFKVVSFKHFSELTLRNMYENSVFKYTQRCTYMHKTEKIYIIGAYSNFL